MCLREISQAGATCFLPSYILPELFSQRYLFSFGSFFFLSASFGSFLVVGGRFFRRESFLKGELLL